MLPTLCGVCLHQVPEKKEPRSYSCLVAPKFQEDDFTHDLEIRRQILSQIGSLFWFFQLSPGHLQLLSSSSSLSSILHLNNWHYHPSAMRKKKSFMKLTNSMEDPGLGPVESKDNKGRSRIYPCGTHSLRWKIQLLFILPPKYASSL